MKMLHTLVAAAMLVCAGSIRGAEPIGATPAQTREGLYQREVRIILKEHGWNVTSDQAGKLVVERPHVHTGGAFGNIGDSDSYARVTITFQPRNMSSTACSGKASLCVYSDGTDTRKLMFPPSRLVDPALTKEYRDTLAEADARLAAERPEFAAHQSSPTDAQRESAVKLAAK